MKKIKLFALAIMAMLSTNAMAEEADGTFTYTVAGSNATITGFVNGLTAAQMETVEIPATVASETSTYDVVGIDGTAGTATKFQGNTSIKKLVLKTNSKLIDIAANSFEGCSALAEVDLSGATNLGTGVTGLGAGAFAGTSIVTLDLSKTKVRVINKFTSAAKATNATLESVIMCDTWTTIGADAFKNCTKLKSINFQTANPAWVEFANIVAGDQTIAAGAFVGTAIEEIDLSGTFVDAIPALTFKAAAADEYKALKTVKLNEHITALNANFSNCTSLASIDLENATSLVALVANEFQYDAKLTSVNLKNLTGATALGANAFEGTGLTSVTIPAAVTAIPDNCFQDCAALETVTFSHIATSTFTGIATMAFAGDTKLTAITIPACLTQAANAIATKAFFMCTGLKSVTFKPAAATTASFNADAFAQCNDDAAANKISIYTTAAYADLAAAPTCTKFDTGEAPAADIAGVVFAKAKYASADKYYVKVLVPAATYIKVKAATGTKVYEGYLDNTKKTLNMLPYLVNDGYYHIGDAAAKQYALIITDNADIAYEVGTAGSSTSTLLKINDVNYPNALNVLEAATSATTLAAAAPAGQVIYGWVNSASKGTGWQNITSGTMPKDGLWCYAAKPAAGGRLNVVWLDENGNIDEEVTAIQNVKAAKAENGAIYNLAGQKVNAAYKGVVIKDGKKYIQK